MVMQLGFALTNNGQVAATYESASTRRFALGRTETVRVCSPESKAWVESMLDDSKSNQERRDLFRKAVSQHGSDMKDASSAQGVDRHILGMHSVQQWNTLTNSSLKVSNCVSTRESRRLSSFLILFWQSQATGFCRPLKFMADIFRDMDGAPLLKMATVFLVSLPLAHPLLGYPISFDGCRYDPA